MALINAGGFQIDYETAGNAARPAVLLVHSSVSGWRQWQALMSELADSNFVIAPNLFGYGETSPWPAGPALAQVVDMLLAATAALGVAGPLAVVGHSYGGAVAFKVAERLGERLAALVQFEPNPFHLLRLAGEPAWAEAQALANVILTAGPAGEWEKVAVFFTDYWLGSGSWAAMPAKRQEAFLASLPPLLGEVPAVLRETVPLAAWSTAWQAPTLILNAPEPRPAIKTILRLLQTARPDWTFATVAAGGHMAPLTRPDLVNPRVIDFLQAAGAPS